MPLLAEPLQFTNSNDFVPKISLLVGNVKRILKRNHI